MIAYFLPLEPGATKQWGSPTHDFWCCHGTLVQAHAIHGRAAYYEHDEGLAVTQYLPTELRWQRGDADVRLRQTYSMQTEAVERPRAQVIDMSITSAQPSEWTLKLRIPDWAEGARVELNGSALEGARAGEFLSVRRAWGGDDRLRITLPRRLRSVALPGDPSMVAFLDGPVALAGLCDAEIALHGDRENPAALLAADNEREWIFWRSGYKTRGQPRNIRFLPLHEIVDQPYTTYFPMEG